MPHPHSSPSVGGNSKSRSMHLSHIILYIYIYTVKTVSPMFIIIAGLRTPASDSGSGLRVWSIRLPSGTEVFNTPRGYTASSAPAGMLLRCRLMAGLPKVLPRSCFGSSFLEWSPEINNSQPDIWTITQKQGYGNDGIHNINHPTWQ